ncbi:MAG: GNAT family N-acetyltransferase [Alphaproteobacteria bacterium]
MAAPPSASQAVEIVAAAAGERIVVERLMQLYHYDFSEFAAPDGPHGELDERGIFPYSHLEGYWSGGCCEALLIRRRGRLAGCVLLNEWSLSGRRVDRVMAEFFVMRKYRRLGVGTRVARTVLGARPGLWEIGIAHYNKPAEAFWRSVVSSFPDTDSETLRGDGQRWSGPILRLRVRP